MSRKRNFTFTWNNYPDTAQATLLGLKHRYIVFGKEVSGTGTPHLQGTIVFDTGRTETAVRKSMPGCHIEVCRDVHASIKYCKKDGKFTSHGLPPLTHTKIGKDEQDRWIRIRQACEDDNTEEVDPKTRFCMYKACEHFKSAGSKKRKLEDTEAIHEWYWGEARTGKSRKARSENPEAYLKMCNKWWDGYNDEEIVLIEDIDKRHEVLAHHLKNGRIATPF